MTHRWKRAIAPTAAIAAVALLAACSSSGSSGSAGGGSSSSAAAGASPSASASGSGDAGLAKAQQMVTQLEGTTASYPVPTASISGVSSLKGKTVFYVPLIQFIPAFVVAAATMKTALAKVGVNLQVCNGQGQPTAVAACAKQAETAGAIGIVTDAIPYGMAQNAFDEAKSKGIPIIIADQYPPTASTTNDNAVTYVPGVADQPSQVAWWVIASSQGKANLIIAEEADSPSSKQYVTNSLPIYQQNCPGCKVTVKTITASTDALLAQATSSNILSTPGVDYYYTEFEDSLQPTVQGIQQSSKTGISLSVAAGTVNGLGLLAGNSVVKAVVAVDEAYEGWALSDEILRMATKSGPVTETIPSRLFTKDNIGTIQVTPAAQSTGEWFGDTSYQGGFLKLWGAA